MKLLVSGGRTFDDVEFIVTHLCRLHKNRPITKLIHGAAIGVDTICGLWAEEMGIPVDAYPITPKDWSTYGKKAGPIRNKQMLTEGKPDFLFAFPGNNGTANMVKQAQGVVNDIWISRWLLFAKEDAKTGFLSNFATGFDFVDEYGIRWDTSEHYYQAMKSPIAADREYVRNANTPATAKRRGNEIKCYSDWETKRLDVMRQALAYKFALGTKAAQLLLDTDIDYLVEYAPWGDTYWGVMKADTKSGYTGKNMLGKLLMEQRDLLPKN